MGIKRVVAIGDLHCGHRAGLTPPGWWRPEGLGSDKQNILARVQRSCWTWYAQMMKELQPIDLLIVNGDAIDGKGHRSGGTEQITSDLGEQATMAMQCINEANAKKVFMTYGTSYHVAADGEDIEQYIAMRIGAQIGGHIFPEVNGLVFDVKHHVGGSSTPYSRGTAVSKEKMWNMYWSEIEGAPKAFVFLRSHVHYFNFCGDDDYLAMTLPALQGFGNKYGSRRCSGIVKYGMVYFDINDNGEIIDWNPIILKSKALGAPTTWRA